MKIKKIDTSKGRIPTDKENFYMLEYFTKQSLRKKRLFLIILVPFAILCGITVIGQLMLILNNMSRNTDGIITLLLFSLFFAGIIYLIKRACNGMPQIQFIKEKDYYVFDVWCEKAINNFNERNEQPSYICTLKFNDESILTDKYFIKKQDIKDYKILKKSYEMEGRAMLVCYFPQIKYAQLFDKAQIEL